MNALRRLTFALLAAVLTFGVAAPGRAADLAVINLINLPADNSAEVYYAQELGFFKDAGLDVHISAMTNSGAIIAALAGGGGDIGNAVVGSVADARGKASRSSTSRRPDCTMRLRRPRPSLRSKTRRSRKRPT